MFSRFSSTNLLKFLKDVKGFERCVQNINVLSLGGGKCKAELKIGEEHTNIMGGLHGGFSATLVDCVSTWALISEEKHAVPNVSVDMHMTYVKGAKVGEEIVIDASTLKAGKTLAFLEKSGNMVPSSCVPFCGNNAKTPTVSLHNFTKDLYPHASLIPKDDLDLKNALAFSTVKLDNVDIEFPHSHVAPD